jgi:hypothetical protein
MFTRLRLLARQQAQYHRPGQSAHQESSPGRQNDLLLSPATIRQKIFEIPRDYGKIPARFSAQIAISL